MRKLLAVSLFVAACGGGSDNSDKVVLNDAPTTTKKDAPSTGSDGTVTGDGTPVPTCVVNSTVTYTQTSAPDVEEDATPPAMYLYIDDDLNTDATPDTFEVYLAVGNGAFASAPIGPGTYPITGDETDFDACGACVTIYGDLDKSSGMPTQLFQAASGTLTITSTTGNLKGSVSNVQLKAVTFDDNGNQVDDGSGCTVSIASASFDAPITVSPANFGGKSKVRAKLHRKK